jgi:hypothetical protein
VANEAWPAWRMAGVVRQSCLDRECRAREIVGTLCVIQVIAEHYDARGSVTALTHRVVFSPNAASRQG